MPPGMTPKSHSKVTHMSCTAAHATCQLPHVGGHVAQVGAEIVLGDRDQRMTMQRMAAMASQYRRKAMQQPEGQPQLVPRHTPSQQGGAPSCLVTACSGPMLLP